MLTTYLKPGGRLIVNYIACLMMSFMVFLSIMMLFSAANTQKIGYTVSYLDEETREYHELYTHYLADGDDAKWDEYQAQGYQLISQSLRSEMSRGANVASLLLSELFTILIYIFMFYSPMYRLGDADANKVSFNRMAYDRWRGFKIGMVPASINLVAYILLILSKLGVIADGYYAVFRLLNCHLFGLLRLAIGNVGLTSQVNWFVVILLLLTVLLTPAACQLFYLLGYKRINLYEKIVYKRKTKEE